MADVSFKNTRFDPDVIAFHAIAQEMAKSVGYTADLDVDAQLAQLLRLRVTQICPCSYCLILHTKAAQDQGIEAAKVAHLASWRESTMFTAAEQAALAYCEALTRYEHVSFPSAHDALVAHFSEKQIAELAAIIINMNLWVRLKLAQGQVPEVQS